MAHWIPMGEPIAEADTHLLAEAPDGVQLVVPVDDPEERYQKDRLLGRGGMGAVWEYKDRRIGRRVAMKVLHPAVAGAAQVQARFLREAQVQGQLEHPAVVPVYDLMRSADGELCFTMKTVRGVTLAEVVEGLRIQRPSTVAKFSRRRILTDFARVCLAIDFAHTRGVLHRDLKPANVMLGDFGEVYVLDWGLAKIKEEADLAATEPIATSSVDDTQAGAVMGTPGYMAPEQVRGDVDAIGPTADVYALGAILFELLALERLNQPGGGGDARPGVRAPDRDVPPELDVICARATAPDPGDRYPSARALHDALEAYLDGERDLELRRAKAASHAEAAVEAARIARAGGPGTLDARRTAMREIGRALALDPEHVGAIQTMVQLLTEPPDETPPEVKIEMDRQDRAKHRWIGRVGAIAYLGIFGFLPVLMWVGIRNAAVVAGFFGFLALCAGLSVVAARGTRPSYRIVDAVMISSNLAFIVGAGFLGPLVLMPAAIAVNATAFAVFAEPRRRILIGTMGCLAILVPLGLELAGLVPASIRFEDGALVLVPRALALPATPTIVFLTVTSVASVLLGCYVVGHIRDTLAAAEQRLYLYTWHVRELVPPSARDATDPTVARRPSTS
jgi:serine/threonine-protein kinase